jgi:YegS/Rv2252/BmrU family lipid kinase
MTRHKVIVNPISGRGAGERSIPLIEEQLRAYGLEFEIVRTERPWHAAELAQEAAVQGYDVVVAVGGDGTADEVLNGLMLAKAADVPRLPAMGIISVGRGNDFAFGMGVPPGVEAGCRVLSQGRPRLVDVGRVTGGFFPQGRYFGNGVGIGFDAVVGFEALKLKWLSGFPSYIVAALKTIFLYFRAPLLQIEYDDQTLTQPSLLVSIMNGRRMGGGFFMAPKGRVDDGVFDLCIARQISRARIFTLMPHFFDGTQVREPEITTGQARRVVVTALEGSLPAHGDGETLCYEGQQLTMELLPHAIEMIGEPQAVPA